MSFSAIPNYGQAIVNKAGTERTWYLFLTDIWKGKPSGGAVSIASTSSPFMYQSTSKGFMIVQGGTVSLIQFSRDGVKNYNTGLTNGIIPLAQGDSILVIYSVAPSLTWVPL